MVCKTTIEFKKETHLSEWKTTQLHVRDRKINSTFKKFSGKTKGSKKQNAKKKNNAKLLIIKADISYNFIFIKRETDIKIGN